MPRPGFVLDVDKSTPPILFHHGENFRLEKLPAGRSRVIYPAEPHPGIDDVDGAIRHALLNPLGECEPLPALLHRGMKLTICFDDVSLPLPQMRRPDIRQRIIEAVLDLAAQAGVDDVHIIAALALHRRMTEHELRHVVGDRVYDAFAPNGLLYNHDAEDLDNLLLLGTTDRGEEVEINKRAAESDLVVYVNINLVSMDGGHKSTATGLASYRSIRHHHNVATMQKSKSFMDRHKSELHSSNWRMGEVIRKADVKIFQIESTLNNDTFGTEGQTDILTMGLPYICPYNVNSVMNPILVMCLGLGYFFNMYRGQPLVREGGVLILSHPTPWDFNPVHHPSYIDFFEQVLSETTDPLEIEQRFEKDFAEDEWYRHLYRTSYAYHGVHPFYMWYWGAHALQHLGRVIIVGGDPAAVRRLGFRPASSLNDAFELAADVVGPSPTITHFHNPPLVMADVS